MLESRGPNGYNFDFSLTKNDVSLETQGHVAQPLQVLYQHSDVVARDTVNDFVATNSLDVLGTLITNEFVVEDIGSCFAGGGLLD